MIENIILLINAIPLPVYIQDLNGHYINCNDRFASYLNLTKGEIIGKTVFEIVENNELAKLASNLNSELITKANELPGQFSWAGNVFTETYKSFIVNKSLLRDINGKIFGIIGTITDTKNNTSFNNELNQTKTVLINNGLDYEALRMLNHEFRTPMNAILGLTNIIYSKEKDPVKKDLLHQIKISNERLLKLIINVLQLSEIESENFNLSYEQFYTEELFKQVISGFFKKAEAKGIQINYFIDKNLPKTLLTSKFAVTVILSNLLSNAIKFSNGGEIKVFLNKVHEKNGNILAEIIVQDQGIGIPINEFQSIFEKFTQVRRDDEEYFSGAGLGLNIVKQIVECMNGSVTVESELGKGSKFCVTFFTS